MTSWQASADLEGCQDQDDLLMLSQWPLADGAALRWGIDFSRVVAKGADSGPSVSQQPHHLPVEHFSPDRGLKRPSGILSKGLALSVPSRGYVEGGAVL